MIYATIKGSLSKPEIPEYPKLVIGKDSGMIVLCSSPTTGTCIDQGHSGFVAGQHFIDFSEEHFMEFTGSVTLENLR